MRALRRQDGFTLIELLVAMVLSAIVFGATLTVLDVYLRQANATTQRNDAQDLARLAIDRIVRQLRNVASPLTTPKLLERATPYDIVFQTIGAQQGGAGGNTSGAERVRYCVPPDTTPGTPADEVLISQTQTWATSTPAADPWSSDPSVTIPCPDTTFAQQPNGIIIATAITNRSQSAPCLGVSGQPVFGFNGVCTAPTDLTQISTIQVHLFVNPTPNLPGATTELQSSAFLRNKQHAPIASFTPYPTGGGGVVLDAGSSYSPDGEQLSYSWSCTSCSSPTTLNAATDGLVSWQPGPGTYTVQLIVKDETGLLSNPPFTATFTVT
jgi:prepilin-type N-terminal cleavage/methylation domain-containing protein